MPDWRLFWEWWYSEVGQIEVQRTHGGRSEQYVRGQLNASSRNQTGREKRMRAEETHVKGHRGMNKYCFGVIFPRMGVSTGVVKTHKSIKDAMFWAGAEGGQSLSLNIWWFHLGCHFQNCKRKTRAGFNDSRAWVLKPDWVQILALLHNSK